MRIEDIATHPDFVRLSSLAGIRVDLRYATTGNFVGRNLYGDLDCAWLHRDAARGLTQAVRWLAKMHPGLQLCVLDALRPHRVQVQLWDHLAGTPLRQYLADPARGSIHSFGMAVDATLLDDCGRALDMGTAFDDLTRLSHPQFEDEYLAQGQLTTAQISHRNLLRQALLNNGFSGIATEWWHFDFGDRIKVRQDYLRIA